MARRDGDSGSDGGTGVGILLGDVERKGFVASEVSTRLCVGAGLNADPCGDWQTMGYVSGGGESERGS